MTISIHNNTLSCNWYGNSYAITSWGGPLRLRAIKLTSSQGISIQFSIPVLTLPKSITQLPFFADNSKVPSKKLSLSDKQMQNLTLTAHFSEKRPAFNRKMDFTTGQIFRDTVVISSTRFIPLQLPSTLESNQTYCLEISSNHPQLKAQLVAVQPLPPAASTKKLHSYSDLEIAVINVSNLAGSILEEPIGTYLVKFGMKLFYSPEGRDLPISPIENQPLIQKTAITEAIKQIPEKTLMLLHFQLAQLRHECKHASSEQKDRLDQQAITLFLRTMEPEKIKEIMSQILRNTCNVSSLPLQIKILITELADQFKDYCMNEL